MDKKTEVSAVVSNLIKLVNRHLISNLVALLEELDDDIKLSVFQYQDGDRKTIFHHISLQTSEMMELVLRLVPESDRLDILSLQDGSELEGLDAHGGDTVLHYAVRSDDCVMVKCILNSLPDGDQRYLLLDIANHRIDVDDIPPYSYGSQTALHLAANNPELISVMLFSTDASNRSALLSNSNAEGNTPIHTCSDESLVCIINSFPVDERLPLFSVKDRMGDSRLLKDIFAGNLHTVKLILNSVQPAQKLQVISMRNDKGKGVLHLMTSTEVCQLIVETLSYNDLLGLAKQQDRDGNTAMHDMCNTRMNDIAAIFKKLLAAIKSRDRFDVLKIKNLYGFTTVHVAAISGNAEAMSILLQSLDHDRRLALLTVLVTSEEAGGVEVRNHYIQRLKPSTKENDEQYLANNVEINRRLSLAKTGSLPTVDSSQGDSALHYAKIKNDVQLEDCILTALKPRAQKEICLVKDVDGISALGWSNQV